MKHIITVSEMALNKLGIIFLSGHGSDMEGTKAKAIQKLKKGMS